jgi:hypothetical protein
VPRIWHPLAKGIRGLGYQGPSGSDPGPNRRLIHLRHDHSLGFAAVRMASTKASLPAMSAPANGVTCTFTAGGRPHATWG